MEHRHDFYEVFWIEEGVVDHHINGQCDPLPVGACVFIRAEDSHSFHNPYEGETSWTNTTFPAHYIANVAERYAKDLAWWPWDGSSKQPFQCQLHEGYVDRLKAYAARLPAQPRRIDVDWFLCQLLRLIEPALPKPQAQRPPEWLNNATKALQNDLFLLAEGQPALVRLCARCSEHINRTCKAHYSMTSTDLVRHLRLEQAARLLRASNEDILSIALTCGFDNLSYFYRCFKKKI